MNHPIDFPESLYQISKFSIGERKAPRYKVITSYSGATQSWRIPTGPQRGMVTFDGKRDEDRAAVDAFVSRCLGPAEPFHLRWDGNDYECYFGSDHFEWIGPPHDRHMHVSLRIRRLQQTSPEDEANTPP